MTDTKVIEVVTPQKYLLNGLWFGGNKPRRVIIFLHGLTSGAFSNHKLVVPLADSDTAVITFNNRGHGKISKIKRLDNRKKKGYVSSWVGEAHEVFTDCVDDIQGVVDFARSKGAKEIYLAGHSTGCQKSIYYLSRTDKQKLIKGVILLAPISDYSAITLFITKKKLDKIILFAKKMVKQGKGNELIPTEIWPGIHNAQRFLSLYTPDSIEEIFTYAQPNKKPSILQKVKTPTLAIYAGDDEYGDRPAKEIGDWFEKSSKSNNLRIENIKGATHNYKGYENEVVKSIDSWVNNL